MHKKQKKIKQGVQIIHSYGNHWIVASTLGCREDEIKIFDSLYTSVNKTQRMYGRLQKKFPFRPGKTGVERLDRCSFYTVTRAFNFLHR